MRQTPLALYAAVSAAILLTACGSAVRQGAVPAAATAAPAAGTATVRPGGNDYAKPDNWLCLPGRTDACSSNLDAALFNPPGEPAGREAFRADPRAAIDCFYVYPTISSDPTPNSDMLAGPEEKRAAEHQFARFGSVCRTFAPVYRQITVAGLRSRLTGQPLPVDPQLAYNDVEDAWNHYLRHHNQGRGVVLVGHSQGARMLSQLVRQQIEGKPVQKQLVSALLIGFNLAVPQGQDTGGTFSQLPLCRSASQTGCAIAYVSFRDSMPPPANSLFGRVPDGQVAACTNPAALAGGRGELRSYLPVKSNLMGQSHEKSRFLPIAQKADTSFASPKAIASAECVQRDGASYLNVSVNPAYASGGVDIAGDLMHGDRLLREWGLHLVDVELAQGNLVDIVRQQGQAWARAAK